MTLTRAELKRRGWVVDGLGTGYRGYRSSPALQTTIYGSEAEAWREASNRELGLHAKENTATGTDDNSLQRDIERVHAIVESLRGEFKQLQSTVEQLNTILSGVFAQPIRYKHLEEFCESIDAPTEALTVYKGRAKIRKLQATELLIKHPTRTEASQAKTPTGGTESKKTTPD